MKGDDDGNGGDGGDDGDNGDAGDERDGNDGGNSGNDGDDVVVECQLPKTLPTLFRASTERNLQLRVVCDFW